MKTKKIIACILASCTMLGSLSLQGIVSITGIANGSDNGVMRDDMTSWDYVDEMGLGINLGNTMEAYYLDGEIRKGDWLEKGRIDSGAQTIGDNKTQNYETCWGAVVTTQSVIDGMKNAGFNTVRIPVYWGNMMENDGTFTINSEYIGRVKEIVDYCRNAGVYAVINIHHYDEFIIRRYLEAGTLEECVETFKKLWTQIANYFKDYSDYLIFEGYNEYLGAGPYQRDKNGDVLQDQWGNVKIADLPSDVAYKWTNTLNQTFVDAVRATGGNNAKRMLIASGYCTNIDNTTNAAFKMPTDTAKDRMMVSVHYIDNNMYWSNQIGSAYWKTYSINQLELLKKAFTEKGIPVFVGELTTSTTYAGDNGTHFATNAEITDSSEVMDFMLRLVKGYDFVPVLWDINDVFYSRTQYKIKSQADADIIEKLAQELSDGTFVPPETGYNAPMSKDEALGVLYSGKPAITLASGKADASMAGAVQVKYIFDCAADTEFNPWAYIELSATVAGTESKNSQSGGTNYMKGETELEAVLDLANPIKEGDSYKVSAYTNAWGDASDYVFLIRRIEFLDARGNIIKTIDKSSKPSEPTIEPTTTATPKTTYVPKTRSAEVVKKDKAAAEKIMKQSKINKLTAKSKAKKNITVNWKKVKKAKGYQVQISAKKNFKKIILKKFTTKKKLTIKNKKIKSKKTYFVRVRAYATYRNAYSKEIKVYSKWNKKSRKVTVK